ncbi:MAG TPA: HAMP domain-containing sensor histidine kinase, partial [Rhodanobacteraceae bacterium]
MSTSANTITLRTSPSGMRNELYFLNWFRVVQAAVYVGLVFSKSQIHLLVLHTPVFARGVALVYLAYAIVALATTQTWHCSPTRKATISQAVDVVAMLLATAVMFNAHTGITMMMLINVGIGALIMPLRTALFYAAIITLGLLGQTLMTGGSGELLAAGLFGVAFFASVGLCHLLGRQIRDTEALATQRGLDLANLAQVNELIIRRMRTGVLLVDDANHVHQFNESAWMLMGSPPTTQRDLGTLAPELSRRLYHWRNLDKHDETAVALADGVPEVVPRFTRLSANDDSNVLIFLDDTSLVSRRAEQLTLASLGRLSASIAHEIRNPLAAIRYAAQLLAESEGLDATDAHMVEIINNHCGRMNDIVENILQLSRRERSRPETIDLNAWVLRFLDEYRESNDLGHDSLRVIVQPQEVEAVVDPQHLHQVIWNLVQNALRYGRMPGEAARVMLITRRASDIGPPLIEVVDRGPGIPPKVAARIFEPFYTTHEDGTGLGLYLARQMCGANQGNLEYVPVAGGGSCFRITLAP